ncbi:MAG: ABC transporter ATP-binding protein [Fastidiosipilaceae bacterium]|nr:ABC transporter ATP-binding protein [Clostridiaceae bacterium]
MINNLRIMAPYFKKIRLYLSLGPIFKLTEAIIELFLPLLMARMIDEGVGAGNKEAIKHYGIWMLILVVVAVLFSFSCQYMASLASQGFGTEVRNGVFHRILSLSTEQLDAFGTGSLTNRLTVDINQMQVGVAMTIRLLSRAPFLCIGGILLALSINWKLSLVLLATVPLVVILLRFVMIATVKIYHVVQNRLDKVAQLIQDNLSGVRVIRAFDRGDRERNFFQEKNFSWQAAIEKAGKVAALINPVSVLIFNFGVVAVLYLGGQAIQVGTLTQGELIALINYFNQIVMALIVVANLALTFTRSFTALDRVVELFKIPNDNHAANSIIGHDSEMREKANQLLSEQPATELVFEHMSYTYPQGSEPALNDIHFRLKPGESLGIIGGTGSGKSTLARLISGYAEPTEGRITWGGQDVSTLQSQTGHRFVQLIFQKALLFSGTVRSNLVMVDPDATEEDMWEVLEIAQADSFVRTHLLGLDQPVERGGLNFSGGQRQRLAIARGLLVNPHYLIMDDCSSGLDYATDAALYKALEQWKDPHLSLIIISQRVYSVVRADRILVLDNGRMVGLGSHEELLETCKLYQEIYATQQEEVDDETA